MRVEVTESPLSPWQLIGQHEAAAEWPDGAAGATASFVGTMRDFNEGEGVSELFLEHYPAMTRKVLDELAGHAMQEWGLTDLLLMHRVGRILPGETIVLIAVWSAHRKEAFAACRYLIEELKSRAPFWKREQRADGDYWVEHNTPG